MRNNYTEDQINKYINFLGKLADNNKGIPKITRMPECLHCQNQKCIKSHSISENVLNQIASPKKFKNAKQHLFKFNDKWFYFQVSIARLKKIPHFENMDNNETILNDCTTNDSSVFDGFCAKCDQDLFDSLDNGINKGKVRFIWELLYRTIAFKIRYMEEEVNVENQILAFAEESKFFYSMWKDGFKDTPIEMIYASKEMIENRIKSINKIIDNLKVSFLNIKSYENKDLEFRKEYTWKEIPLSKESLNFLGINYISYIEEVQNLKINKLNSDFLVSQFGYESLSWNEENQKYHYSQIIICQKKSQETLEEIINEFGAKELINNILIESEKMHANTFLKRTTDPKDKIESKTEKIMVGKLLNMTHYSKIYNLYGFRE